MQVVMHNNNNENFIKENKKKATYQNKQIVTFNGINTTI